MVIDLSGVLVYLDQLRVIMEMDQYQQKLATVGMCFLEDFKLSTKTYFFKYNRRSLIIVM